MDYQHIPPTMNEQFLQKLYKRSEMAKKKYS
jgi:hypothetical protein